MSARSASARPSVEGAAERAPRETDALSAPWGVQSRSGLGARVPLRWPRPETGKISLVRFLRNVRLSPSLRETNALGSNGFGSHSGQVIRNVRLSPSLRETNALGSNGFGSHSGQVIRLRKGRADWAQDPPVLAGRSPLFVSRGTTYSRARSLAEGSSNGREI